MTLRYFLDRAFFDWLQNDTRMGQWLDSTPLIFPVFATAHLLGLAVLLGATLVVDLRLMGYGMRRQSAAQLASYLEPWVLISILVMAASGIPMFMSEAVKASAITAVFWKIVLLIFAIVVHYTIHRSALKHGAREGTGFGMLVGCLSLFLWLSVAFAGRAIGFLYVLDPGAALQ